MIMKRIINIMKSRTHPFQSDSISTQQRQKKFTRKSDHNSSRSISSRSDSKSLSKFFVKNLQTKQKPENIQKILNKNIKMSSNWSPPRRQVTPSKTEFEKKITLSNQQLIQAQRKQIQNLKQQISKYRAYINKSSDKLDKKQLENEKLQQEIQRLKVKLIEQQSLNQSLNKVISELNQNLSQKDIMLQTYERDQPSLKKMKISIMKSRMMEFEKEKDSLTKKIKNLEGTIDEIKGSNGTQSTASLGKFSLKRTLSQVNTNSIFNDEEYYQKLQSELYLAREQIKKLQISEACTKRKCYLEAEVMRTKKQKEYEELKKRFTVFLGKYKLTMKKIASSQVKNALEKKRCEKSSSIESQISFTLSQDEQRN